MLLGNLQVISEVQHFGCIYSRHCRRFNSRPRHLEGHKKADSECVWTLQVASEAAMQYPEEVYRPGTSGGAATVAEAELSREERRARRGAKKRSAKKHRAQKVCQR